MYSASNQTDTPEKRQFFSNIKSEDYEIICKNEVVHIIYSDLVYRQIAEILFQVLLIKRIFILRTDNTFSIWTELKKYSKEARYSLYRQELEVIKYFSAVEFHFDFHVADPQDVRELLSSGAKQILPQK